MNKKLRYFLLSFFTTLGIFLFDPNFMAVIVNFVNLLIEKVDSIKSTIGYTATFISIAMYIKLRFIDTKTFNKMQSAYGKQKFLDSLVIILNMLEVMNPEQVLNKIAMTNKTEIEMQKSMQELAKLLTPVNEDSKCVELQLDRKEQKELAGKIKVLIDLIDKRLEMHYISKDILKDKVSTFNDSIEKSIRIKKKHKPYEDKVEQIGKKHVFTNLTK